MELRLLGVTERLATQCARAVRVRQHNTTRIYQQPMYLGHPDDSRTVGHTTCARALTTGLSDESRGELPQSFRSSYAGVAGSSWHRLLEGTLLPGRSRANSTCTSGSWITSYRLLTSTAMTEPQSLKPARSLFQAVGPALRQLGRVNCRAARCYNPRLHRRPQ